MSKSENLSLPVDVFTTFCEALNKSPGKFESVGVQALKGKGLRFHASNHAVSVTWMCDSVSPKESFSVGVDGDKLIALGRRFYGESMSVTLQGNSLTIKNNNIKGKFPVSDVASLSSISELTVLPENESTWVVSTLPKVRYSYTHKVSSEMASAILIDFGDSYTRICRITPTAVFISSMEASTAFRGRVVVPVETARLLHSLGDVRQVKVSAERFMVVLSCGVVLTFAALYDPFPKDYILALGLVNDMAVVEYDEGVAYRFSRDNLSAAVDVVASVIKEDSSFVTFRLIGEDSGTKYPVWEIGGLSSIGCDIAETVRCTGAGVYRDSRFSVNKKDCLSLLRVLSEQVVMIDRPDVPAALCSDDGRDCALLIKSS